MIPKHPCTPYYEWIVQDAPLSPEQQARLEAHLDQCATCRNNYQALQQFDALLSTPLYASPPPGFADRVLVRLQTYRAQSRNRAILGLSIGVAIDTLILFILTLIWASHFFTQLHNFPLLIDHLSRTFHYLGDLTGTLIEALLAIVTGLAHNPTFILCLLIALLTFGLNFVTGLGLYTWIRQPINR